MDMSLDIDSSCIAIRRFDLNSQNGEAGSLNNSRQTIGKFETFVTKSP